MLDFKEVLKEFEEKKAELYIAENEKEQQLLNDICKNSIIKEKTLSSLIPLFISIPLQLLSLFPKLQLDHSLV
ncbi:hypothetical protein [Paenibacillus luteus]|uniref:hypothetical protein n=1 Tax=Paenibacillus luteus TaxID=2545753 RepID=UPI00114511CE|nr:hypothetical protein [Paenibacillus luteus]